MFKPSFIILAVLIGLGAAYAQAGRAEVQVLQGKIGSAPIIMQLGISKDSYGRIAAGGRYFYRKYKTDIPLSGYRTEQGDLHLIEWAWKVDDDFGDDSDVPDGAVRARITLTPKGKGWRGTWQEKDTSKTLPVTLEPLNPAELAGARFKVSEYTSAYDIVRLTGMSLQAGGKEKFMGYTLEWMEEPITKLDMFRVRDGFSDEALKRINAALEARQFGNIMWYFDCQGNGGFNFEQSVTPCFLNKRLLSVSIFTDWFCGGAHPDFGDAPLNLDIESGKALMLEDLLWLGTGEPRLPREANGDRKNYEYETEILGPWLTQTLTRLYPKEMEPREAENEAGENEDGQFGCDYSDVERWRFAAWYLTEKGIYFIPSFPTPARVCHHPGWGLEWNPVVPWDIINQHPGRLKNLP